MTAAKKTAPKPAVGGKKVTPKPKRQAKTKTDVRAGTTIYNKPPFGA